MNRNEVIKRIILLIIIFYIFLVSINLLGLSFKLFGKDFAENLISITTNPFVGLFIGILATSLIQSSSATTSIVVGLTASGALTIGNAIPIIMGANIGTSVTNTIVSLGHIKSKDEFRRAFEVATIHDFFNFFVVLILFPLEIIFHPLEKSAIFLTKFFLGSNIDVQFTSPLKHIIQPVTDFIRELASSNALILLILAALLLFFSLSFFGKIIRPIAKSEFRHSLHNHIFNKPLKSFSFGLILTAIVQSSSITTSLIVPLAGVGIFSLDKIFPYILGANIGTTFTALFASLATDSPAAITVALVHILFNTLGAIMIYPLRRMPLNLSVWLAKLSMKSRIFPLCYIFSMFYLVPGIIIFFFH